MEFDNSPSNSKSYEHKLTMFKQALMVILFLSGSWHVSAETRFVEKIPDFTQTDIRGDSFGNGNQFCGPVAVSNSIAWLTNQRSSQLDIALKLASKDYMNTSVKIGTGTKGLLRGVAKISRDLFGGYKRLEYQGWRLHQRKFSSGIKVPKLSWIKSGITPKSTVWLNVGWYKKKKNGSDYVRTGGHWVTLAGYKNNGTLIVHDPSPRAGRSFSSEYVSVKKLTSGTLTGKKTGLPIDASGFLSLGKGMHIKSGADFAIIDGAVLFEIP